MTREQANSQLINHLDRKLGHLEQEYLKLLDASSNLKASLSEQKVTQDSITLKLLNKMDAFHATDLGSAPTIHNTLALRNIQQLTT